MKGVLITGVGLMAIEAFVFTSMFGFWGSVWLCVIAALPAVYFQRQWKLSGARQILIALFAFMMFTLWWVYQPITGAYNTVILDRGLSGYLAAGFLFLQTLHLYVQHREKKDSPRRMLPLYFPFLGLVVIVFAGDHYLYNSTGKTPYLIGCLCFSLCTALFYGQNRQYHPTVTTKSPRKGRWILAAITFLLTIALATGTGRTLRSAESSATLLYMARVINTTAGELRRTSLIKLGSIPRIKQRDASRIVLRATAEEAPGYLRGNVFSEYSASSWKSDAVLTPALPAAPPQTLPKKSVENYFELQKSDQDPTGACITIWPEPDINTTMFIPYKSIWLSLRVPELKIDQYGLAEAINSLNGQRYRTFPVAIPEPETLTHEDIQRYTQLPDTLDPRIPTLARTVLEGADSTQEKIARVTTWFHNRYDYFLGMVVPPDQDPMTYFLCTDPPPPAHCEFFASGACLLLRAEGVPCRYVTGVVAWEPASLGSEWLARYRDAHAWAEAYDEVSRQWVIVEATPGSGVPGELTPESHSRMRDLIAFLRFRLRQLWTWLNESVWQTLKVLFQQVAHGCAARPWLFLIPGLLLMAWFWRGKRTRHASIPVFQLARQVQTMRALLKDADRLARREGLVRTPIETIHDFSNRIKGEGDKQNSVCLGQLADWYRQYADLRYQPQVKEEHILKLQNVLPRK